MTIIESLQDLLKTNPYFSAGFGLLGVGAGLGVARQALLRSLYFARRRMMITMEVSSKDANYGRVLAWLTQQRTISGNHYSLQSSSKSISHGRSTTSLDGKENSADGALLLPSPGIHYLRWRHRWIRVDREREKGFVPDLATGMPFETITISTIGRSKAIFLEMLEEAKQLAAEREQGKLQLYTAFAGDWRPFGAPRRRRPLSSVILAKGIAESILSDVRNFLASSQWYTDRGIPYRRGYLLHGPPGGGKSSFVHALASELGYGICVLNLSEGFMSDDRLNQLLNCIPENTILLLEDIDAAQSNRSASTMSSSTEKVSRQPGGITLSGLLNALDGVAAAEERLIFMTTNHIDRLDAALIRPGRVDVKKEIGMASGEQAARMFAHFYPDLSRGDGGLAERFGEVVGEAAGRGHRISPADIQGHFILYKQSPMEALRTIENLLLESL